MLTALKVRCHRTQALPSGYDERFRRLWDFYLSSSEAGFRERRIGDVQVHFAKPHWR